MAIVNVGRRAVRDDAVFKDVSDKQPYDEKHTLTPFSIKLHLPSEENPSSTGARSEVLKFQEENKIRQSQVDSQCEKITLDRDKISSSGEQF